MTLFFQNITSLNIFVGPNIFCPCWYTRWAHHIPLPVSCQRWWRGKAWKQGATSISYNTSCCKISQCREPVSVGVKMITSLWNLIGGLQITQRREISHINITPSRFVDILGCRLIEYCNGPCTKPTSHLTTTMVCRAMSCRVVLCRAVSCHVLCHVVLKEGDEQHYTSKLPPFGKGFCKTKMCANTYQDLWCTCWTHKLQIHAYVMGGWRPNILWLQLRPHRWLFALRTGDANKIMTLEMLTFLVCDKLNNLHANNRKNTYLE